MISWLIQHESNTDRYWSLYGWAPLQHAMRFSCESDAKGFRDTQNITGGVKSADIDDLRRPDVRLDYNPFSTGKA